MQVSALLTFFSFFLAIHSLAIEQRSCISPDVIAITQQVTDPHYFCAWYLSDGRTRSPIPNIDADALVNACRCVASVEPAGTHAKLLADIAKAARLQSFVSATCPSMSANPIAKEFRNASSFCDFFNSFERHDSPIPDLNTPAVRKACRCVLSSTKSTTKSSSTERPSSITKSTTANSSPSIKRPSSKTSSTKISKLRSKTTSSKRSSSLSTRSFSTKLASSKSLTKPSLSKIFSSKSSVMPTSSRRTSTNKLSSSKLLSSTVSSSLSLLSKTTSSTSSGIGSITGKPSSTRVYFKSSKSTPGVFTSSRPISSVAHRSSTSSPSTSSTLKSFSVSSISSTSSSAAMPLSTNFWIKVVGGPFDGAYLSTRFYFTDEEQIVEGVITATHDPSVPAVFSIDPASQLLTAKLAIFPVSYGIHSQEGVHAQLYPYRSSMTPILCKDVEGYLECATPDQTLTVFAVEGEYTYLTSQPYESANSPEYVGVKYQIVYQPISVASSTTSSSARPTSTLDAYDMITSKHLEEFCTSYLGYTTPSVTQTITYLANSTRTDVFTSNVTSTSFALTTETSFTQTVIVTSTASIQADKRTLQTPPALASYPEGAINSGCIRVVSRPATMVFTETVVVTSFKTVATTTTTVAYETDTSKVTELATSTSTSIVAPSQAFCANGQQVDGLTGSCGSGPCITFNLRIEGATDTIYEGLITTGPMSVTTDRSGTHLCNGENIGAIAAGTATTALVSAGDLCGFDFDGDYEYNYQDFFISRIGPQTLTTSQEWGIFLNGQINPRFGCSIEPAAGDHVLWAFSQWQAPTLQVMPETVMVSVGSTHTFTVTDSQSGDLVPGAAFGGSSADSDGQVTVAFPTTGAYRYKATMDGAVRSNGVIVTVV